MTQSRLFHDENRALQDKFHSRAIADRIEEKLSRTAFTAGDTGFIESAIYFFLATADAEGRPDVSFKGGPEGFVQVTGPSELSFPDYDGNGMFKSLGNIRAIPTSRCSSLPCTSPRDGRGGFASTAPRPSATEIPCSRPRSGRS